MKKYILFTTPTCPNCPTAKSLLKESGIEGEIVDASQPEGLEKAKQFEIKEIPTALLIDEEGKIISRFQGIDDIEDEFEK